MKKQLLGIVFVIIIAIIAAFGIYYFASDDIKTDQAILNLSDLKVNDQSDHLAPVDLPVIIDHDASVDLPIIEDDISMDSVPKAKDLLIGSAPKASAATDFNGEALVSEDDILTLSVSYSGGCEEHDFDLYWDGSFAETALPFANLLMFHENNNDMCEAYITEEIQFDISKLKEGYISNYGNDVGSFYVLIEGLQGRAIDFDYEI
jgi:hypothetical protein